ncbi:MFS transporter [Leucobacter sp. CSA1]|uniref:Putative proline/betaine transporter n=1 Tax=Leucobacter chromiisoli TaxID=2796471 RepID=A0A934Q912_9MICO|nr:MFS transporter [Leucobacter chromiisoli]MBK0419037.1 MFS transporter [Leucobacter chromiisoli]
MSDVQSVSLETGRPERIRFTKDQRFQALRASIFGNLLEWYDWTIYAVFTPYIAARYFDAADPTSATLSALAVFAVGFLARPLGGVIFGRMGDKLGRKMVMVITMILMAIGSLLIAVLPGYAQIGWWASVLLVITRLVQGLAHGGETGVAYTYIAEAAPIKSRGFFVSWIYVAVTLGVMGATGMGAVLTSVLEEPAMNSWGWRVPFIVGALLGIIAIYIRRSIDESPVYEEEKTQPVKVPTPLSRREITKIVFRIVLLSCSTNVAYYTWSTFAPSYAIAQHGMDSQGAYIASTLAQVVALVALPLFGLLSDKIGRRPIVMIAGVSIMVMAFPLSWILGTEPWTLFLMQGLGLLIWASVSSIYPTLMAEQVPTRARATGVGFVTSLSVAIFGGTAPYLNTWLASIGMSWVFSAYIVGLGALALVGWLIMDETAGVDLAEIGEGAPRRRMVQSTPIEN